MHTRFLLKKNIVKGEYEMNNYTITNRTAEENKAYKNLLREAYGKLDEAINEITYVNKFTDCSGNKLNQMIIDEIDNIIIRLESLEDATIFKPIKVKE